MLSQRFLLHQIKVTPIWKQSSIDSIPKRGNSTNLDNQRGISKSCASAKLFNKLLLNRIKPIIEHQLLQCQSGFRSGRSTTEYIIALQMLVDFCRTEKRTASIVFVDFRKTFDTLNRAVISPILRDYGIPKDIVEYIQQMYTETTASVSTSHGETRTFKTSSGVLQGDTLSPFFYHSNGFCLKTGSIDSEGFRIARCRSSGSLSGSSEIRTRSRLRRWHRSHLRVSWSGWTSSSSPPIDGRPNRPFYQSEEGDGNARWFRKVTSPSFTEWLVK